MSDQALQDESPHPRSFIFLQGPTSTAFRDLGRSLARRGHRVLKINLCPGDWIFWNGADTISYRGSIAGWPDFLEDLLQKHSATDIVYFADRFPYHKAAQSVARRMGVRPVALEYGYIRPDWLILEEGGQSAYSHFPADPAVIRATSARLPALDRKRQYDIPAWQEMICEPLFHLSNALLRVFAPRYAPSRYYPELQEFPAYIPRFIRRARNAKAARALLADLAARPAVKYLIPLQMQNDYQIRENAPPDYQHGFVREVLASFRRAAPQDAELIFKLHPMDNGLERWDLLVPRMAAELGLAGRVHVLDGLTLGELVPIISGCVVINSTIGLDALRSGIATKVMGVAIYDMPGLTHEGPLDSFWTEPAPPDLDLAKALVRCLGHGIHVRGTVYGAAGRAAFVRNAVARLEADHLHCHGLYVATPPRLTDAAAKGVAAAFPHHPDHACPNQPA